MSSDETYVVYALIDPRDNTLHYVGITKDVYRRFSQHMNGSSGNIKKNGWIFECRQANVLIVMTTLETIIGMEAALECEKYWIAHYLRLGMPLGNVPVASSIAKEQNTLEKERKRLKKEVEDLKAEQAKLSGEIEKQKGQVASLLLKQQQTTAVAHAKPEQFKLKNGQNSSETSEQNNKQQQKNKSLPLELQAVYEAYRTGMTTRDLGKVLGVSHPTAGKLLQRLKDKGLIEPEKRGDEHA